MTLPLFGSHLSAAGGCFNAVYEAHRLGFDCVQVFTKNNNQWQAPPLKLEAIDAFKKSIVETKISHPIAHVSYLINLGSADDVLWNKSIDALVDEIERAHELGIPHVVAHPGSHGGAGEEAGIERIALGLREVLRRTKSRKVTIALETTAGQGASIGHRFEHLGEIIRKCGDSDRLTVCLDTCHVFAAGYALAPAKEYKHTWKSFFKEIDLERLVAIHANDSKKKLGSRVDRHEHIGRGELGIEPFSLLVNDKNLARVPFYLETAKEVDPETDRQWDSINLELLRSLVKRSSAGKSRSRPG